MDTRYRISNMQWKRLSVNGGMVAVNGEVFGGWRRGRRTAGRKKARL